jgi:hypothetical protein
MYFGEENCGFTTGIVEESVVIRTNVYTKGMAPLETAMSNLWTAKARC